MKKLFIFIFILVLFINSSFAYSRTRVPVNMTIKSFISSYDVEWSPDSKKILLYNDNNIYLINLKGNIRTLLTDYDLYRMDWMDNYNIVLSNYNINILNIKNMESKIYEYNAVDIGTSEQRQELALSDGDCIEILDLRTEDYKTILGNLDIGQVFYNSTGNRLFFTHYGMFNEPVLYTYEFSTMIFDRISEAYLVPIDHDENNDLLYCDKYKSGEKIGTVVVDLITLKISNYVKRKDLQIKGMGIDLNIKNYFDFDKNISIFLSPDRTKALVIDEEKVEVVYIDESRITKDREDINP